MSKYIAVFALLAVLLTARGISGQKHCVAGTDVNDCEYVAAQTGAGELDDDGVLWRSNDPTDFVKALAKNVCRRIDCQWQDVTCDTFYAACDDMCGSSAPYNSECVEDPAGINYYFCRCPADTETPATPSTPTTPGTPGTPPVNATPPPVSSATRPKLFFM